MKLFVTVGLERKPFDRLLKAVDLGIEQKVFPEDTLVQKGHSHYSPKRCRVVPFLSYAGMLENLKTAEVVIAHAGVGTLLQALHQKKIPILYPRRARWGEHVDDHQIMFAQVIEARKRALVAYNPKQLYRLYRDYARLADGISGTATTDNGGARLRQYLQTRLQARIDPGEEG